MLCTALTPYPVQYSLIVTYFQLVENILHQQTVYAVYHKQPKVIFLIYCLGVEGFQQVWKECKRNNDSSEKCRLKWCESSLIYSELVLIVL